jgi:hypothetical protein
MEHIEKLAIELEQHKPSLWLHYTDDTFVVWPHGPERLLNFLSHLNSLRPSSQSTMELDSDPITSLDVLVIRKDTTLATNVYRNPPTLADISTSFLNILRMWKRVLFNVFTKELTSYAKNIQICVMKSVASDMIFSLTVIPKV